jgi:hypothetical protein
MAGCAASRVEAGRSTAAIVRVRSRLRLHPAASPHRQARAADSVRRRRAARQMGMTARPMATAAHPVGTAARPVGTAARPVGTAAHPLVMAARCRRNPTPPRRAPTPPQLSRSRSSAPRCGVARMYRRTPSHRRTRRTGHGRPRRVALYRHPHPAGCRPTGSNPAWNRRPCRSGRHLRLAAVIKGRMAAGHRATAPPQRRARRADHGSAGLPVVALRSQRLPNPPVRRFRSVFRSPGSI